MLTKNWYWILAALVVGIGSFQILRPKEPLETIKIYKTATPAPKPSPAQTSKAETTSSAAHGHSHNHPHPHGTASHSHATESITTSSASDWRDDSGFDLPFSQNDRGQESIRRVNLPTVRMIPIRPETGTKQKTLLCILNILRHNSSNSLGISRRFRPLWHTRKEGSLEYL